MKSNDTEFIQKELMDLKALMFGIDDLITDVDSRIIELNKYFIETEEYSMGELLDMMFFGFKKRFEVLEKIEQEEEYEKDD